MYSFEGLRNHYKIFSFDNYKVTFDKSFVYVSFYYSIDLLDSFETS